MTNLDRSNEYRVMVDGGLTTSFFWHFHATYCPFSYSNTKVTYLVNEPILITECGKSLKSEEGLKIHMRLHTGDLFKCDYCSWQGNTRYVQHYNLQGHIHNLVDNLCDPRLWGKRER